MWTSFKWQVDLGERFMMANSAHSLDPASSERRTSPRYSLHADLEFRVLSPGRECWIHRGRTLNMSRSGLLFETDSLLDHGLPVELWIDWPARPRELERWLRVWGWVVRQHDRAVAVAIRQYSFEPQRKRTQ